MKKLNNGNSKKEISRNELLDEIGGWLVVFGLSVEVILAIALHGNEPWFEKWPLVIANVIIVVGVWIEIHFGGDARAEANARAEEAKLELAKLKIPRFLSPEKLQSLWNAISPLVPLLKGKVVFGASDDAESRQFAQYFMMIFAGSGIIKGNGVSFGHSPSSVPFTMLSDEDILLGISDFHSHQLAIPLFNAFESAGFTVKNVSMPTNPSGEVMILIPPKRTW